MLKRRLEKVRSSISSLFEEVEQLLDHLELETLYETMLQQMPEKLLSALSKANRTNALETLLEMLGMSDLIETNDFDTLREGKIVVNAELQDQ